MGEAALRLDSQQNTSIEKKIEISCTPFRHNGENIIAMDIPSLPETFFKQDGKHIFYSGSYKIVAKGDCIDDYTDLLFEVDRYVRFLEEKYAECRKRNKFVYRAGSNLIWWTISNVLLGVPMTAVVSWNMEDRLNDPFFPVACGISFGAAAIINTPCMLSNAAEEKKKRKKNLFELEQKIYNTMLFRKLLYSQKPQYEILPYRNIAKHGIVGNSESETKFKDLMPQIDIEKIISRYEQKKSGNELKTSFV
ncbi:hypothetical protein ACFL6I_16250 [candidate division KSB1 bacterium]